MTINIKAITFFALGIATTVLSSAIKSSDISQQPSNFILPNTIGYSVSIPKVLIANSSANICLTLYFVSDFDGQLQVSLRSQSSNELISKANVQSFIGTHKCFDLFVPPTHYSTATLYFDGHFGNRNFLISNNATLSVEQPVGSIVLKQNYKRDPKDGPNFFIYITVTPKIILHDVPKINFKFCANYSNGDPVHGILRVSMSRTSSVAHQKLVLDFLVLSMIQSMRDGCYSVNVSRHALSLDYENLNHLDILNITADVTDRKTKVKVSTVYQVETKLPQPSYPKQGKQYKCKIIETTAYGSKYEENFKVEIQTHDEYNGSHTLTGQGLEEDHVNFPLYCSDETISAIKIQIVNLEESKTKMEAKLKSLEVQNNTQAKDGCQKQLTVALNDYKNYFNASESEIAALEKAKVEMEAKINSMSKIYTEQMSELLKKVKNEIDQANENFQQRQTEATNDYQKKLSTSQIQISSLEKKITLLETRPSTYFSDWMDPLPQGSKQFYSLVYSWKITGIKQKMGQNTFVEESPVFPLSGYPFQAKVKLSTIAEGLVRLLMCFVDVKKTGKPMELKVNPEVGYIVRDRSGNVKNNDIYRPSIHLYDTTFIYGGYYHEATIGHKTGIVLSPYNIGDSVVIDILVDPPSIVQQTHSNDGILIWKINHFTKKKVMEKDGLLRVQRSPYFYSSPNGYRMQMRMLAYGMDAFKGKGPTVDIAFLQGEYDSTLPKSFKHKIQLTIYNQKDSGKHMVKTVEKNLTVNERTWTVDVATHSEIENGGFLVNDTLICRVVVEAL